jgi:hypothetical protein
MKNSTSTVRSLLVKTDLVGIAQTPLGRSDFRGYWNVSGNTKNGLKRELTAMVLCQACSSELGGDDGFIFQKLRAVQFEAET